MEIEEVWDGRELIYSKTDFDHECGYKRGQLRTIYSRDFGWMMVIWNELRAILDRKK
jgi:hypothetical protein